MYGRGHEQGTRKQTASQSTWYADIEAANIRAAEDAERTLVEALATQVGNAIVKMPEAAERIRKAAKLTQHHEIWPISEKTWLVGSQSSDQEAYLVKRGPWSCTCPDWKVRGGYCKHIISVFFVVKMGDAYQPCYK